MERTRETMRHRAGRSEAPVNLFRDNVEEKVKRSKDVPTYYGLILFVFLIVSLKLNELIVDNLPAQLSLEDEKLHPDRFIGGRAESFLKRLTDIGTRVVGSYENEVLAVDLLKREISFIIQQSESIHKIETDIQKPVGSYYLSFKPFNFKNYYANIQNIVVKFQSVNSSSDSILMNCHYDTVPESPGAGDNGLNCAVMLEVLTKLSKSKKPLRNSVIFLFNGAEENPLQASHAFITQHKWSKTVKTFINLDCAGNGGKEFLFQSPAGFPWLFEMYAKVAVHPQATVEGEEIYLSGILPSDTDYRIFKDFGEIPGFDFAHYRNGYVYHTRFDSIDFIPPGTYQSTGDNMLALVTELASSPRLGSINKTDQRRGDHWKIVYYDYFGMFIVSYSEFVAIIINITNCVISIFVVFRVFTFLSGSGNCLRDMTAAFGVQITNWILSCSVLLFITKFLDWTNSTLSWYAHPWKIIPLYVLPFMFVNALISMLWCSYKRELPDVTVVRCLNGNHLLWIIILFLGTVSGIRSVHNINTTLFISTLGSAIASYSRKRFSVRRYIYMISLCTAYNIFHMGYNMIRLLISLIPMTGRMGPQFNAEIIVCVVIIVSSLWLSQAVLPTLLLRNAKLFLTGILACHILSLVLVTCTPFGFPYSEDLSQPAFQRMYILHSERTFHDSKGNVRKNDSGFFVQSLDRNNINYVSKIVPELENARPASDECLTELNCGGPIYHTRFIRPAPYAVWVDAAPPVIHHPTNLEVTSQTPIDIRTRKIHFVVTGPDHISIVFSPRIGVQLVKWSFDSTEPPLVTTEWTNRKMYLIYYSHGLMGGTLEFDLYLEVDPNAVATDSILDIAVVGHYMHDKAYRTEEYRKFMSKFPNWVHVTPWVTTYKSWII